jgi:ArsR family transcriptional regulator, arsenate/arsenite/antimonite-responsive transcriptional repressor
MRTRGVARASRRAAGRPSVRLLFRAFSDPIRLRILHLLREREACVGDLVTVLRVPQGTTSRHLTYLRRAALVRTRRSGLWIHYSLGPARGALHASLIECLASCAREMPELGGDRRRLATLRKTGGCCPGSGVRPK